MKKFTLILTLLVGSSVYCQDLTFSRVIDTVLVLQTGPTPVNISSKFIGETLTPDEGKVFKINNILFQKLHIPSDIAGDYNAFECNNPNNNENQLQSGVDIYDGEKEFVIIKKQTITGMVDPSTADANNNTKFPLWMNSNSTLRTYAWQGGYNTQLQGAHICVKNYMCKAYISLIEFNTQ